MSDSPLRVKVETTRYSRPQPRVEAVKYLHCMVDVESLGPAPSGAIVQIGAVMFAPWMSVADGDEHEGMVSAPGPGQFRVNVKLDSPNFGELDGPTVGWWLEQDPDAIRRVFADGEDRVDLYVALRRFNQWMAAWMESLAKVDEETGDVIVPKLTLWGWPSVFDITLLQNACRRTGVPWMFGHRGRCFGTLRNIGEQLGVEEPLFVGVRHDALDDAAHQANHALLIMRYLGIE